MWEITPLIEFATESKRIQKFVFDPFCPFEQKPDKCQFQHQVCYPCKRLEKVKVILAFTHGGKFEANAAFTTFAFNAKLWQI